MGKYGPKYLPSTSASEPIPTSVQEGADREGLLDGPIRKRATIQCLNVRGLALVSNRVKVQTLENSLVLENRIAMMLSEIWLSDNISNAELQMDNYEIF